MGRGMAKSKSQGKVKMWWNVSLFFTKMEGIHRLWEGDTSSSLSIQVPFWDMRSFPRFSIY